METMIDEIAQATGKDPVALRLELLAKQPRDAAVVRLVAEKAGWNGPSLGERVAAGASPITSLSARGSAW
jgi:isoquinoline 1-oxidoreductase beta subunit